MIQHPNRLDTFSSNLPLVLFDDNGFGLLPDNDVYYPGWMGAFSSGSLGVRDAHPNARTSSRPTP